MSESPLATLGRLDPEMMEHLEADFSYTMEDQAAVLDRLLAALPPLPLHIAAHSMGGAVGLLLAPATMARVRSFANLEGNLIAADCGFSRQVAGIPFAEYRDRVFPEQQAALRGDPALRLDHTTATAVHRSSRSPVQWSDSGQLPARFLGLPCKKPTSTARRTPACRCCSGLAGSRGTASRGAGTAS